MAFGLGAGGGAVPAVEGADEHADLAALERGHVEPGAFERLVRHLQEHALLRVGGQRLARRDAEEAGVEVARAVHEAAFPGVAGAGGAAVRVVQGVEVPAAVLGEGADGVPALRDEPPQPLRVLYAAGEAAAHRHDRDGLAAFLLDLAQPLPGALEVGGDPPEVVEEPLFIRHVVSPSERFRALCRSARATRRRWRSRCRRRFPRRRAVPRASA